ncbi:MAG: exosome complex exonuclease Rrp41 [Candidatus Diapherotrites archaeon]|uniref:Exosome complex exonuclease Rrp41 n=1 Tax=Candidatus Iainarchaeum sp. TaxID=3101447 RepID=A0A8T4L7E3_9ARCH|nr:exosome complex exonuclease Rrp41 [Candidatus Diapherotrites archaeon]
MAKKKEEELTYVDKKGKRLDGRGLTDLRPIKIEVGVVPRADGSAYLEWGQNKVVAAVYGPKECLPKHTADPLKGRVNFYYRMATFSVPDRKNPKPGRRETEISKVCSEALQKAIFLEQFPNTAIDVHVEILDANAGTRIAGLTAAAVALADAGIPMRGVVAGCTVGRAGGQIMLDVTKEEEDAPDAVDIPIAIIPSTEEIVLLQMDGLFTKAEWEKALPLGLEGCKKIAKLQEAALKKRFETKEFLESVEAERVSEQALPQKPRVNPVVAAGPMLSADASETLDEENQEMEEALEEEVEQ